MSSFPGSLFSQTDPVGTNLVAILDHGLQHKNLNDEVAAIELWAGTNSGTNLFGAYVAGNFPLRVNSSNIPQAVVRGGTFNNGVFGTMSATGGTHNNGVFGTATLQAPTINGLGTNSGTVINGVYNSATLGTPTVQGSVIGSANILDGNVPERKIRMDQLAGTTLTGGTTASGTLVGVVGGSVTINLNVASNVMIYFGAIQIVNGGGVPLFSLFTDGAADTIWNDTNGAGGWNASANAFTAWRTGLAAGTHTWQMKWRTSAGTATIQSFELIVQPFSQ